MDRTPVMTFQGRTGDVCFVWRRKQSFFQHTSPCEHRRDRTEDTSTMCFYLARATNVRLNIPRIEQKYAYLLVSIRMVIFDPFGQHGQDTCNDIARTYMWCVFCVKKKAISFNTFNPTSGEYRGCPQCSWLTASLPLSPRSHESKEIFLF